MARSDAIAGQIDRYGQTVTIRRRVGTGATFDPSVSVKAKVHHFTPQELVGGIQQGDRRVTIAPAELVTAGWDTGDAPRKGDQVVIDSNVATVQACDVRYVSGVEARKDIRIRGCMRATAAPLFGMRFYSRTSG